MAPGRLEQAGRAALGALAVLGAATELAAQPPRHAHLDAHAARDVLAAVPLSESSAAIRPPDGSVVEQTPPDFSWPDVGAGTEYRVTLIHPDGTEQSLHTAHNWINWPEVLPRGEFSWHVQATNADGTRTSRTRRFTVAADAVAFLVPDADTLLSRATGKAHPRALPDATRLRPMLERRHNGVTHLVDRVDDATTEAPEPSAGSEEAVEAQAYGVLERTLNALFAYVATNHEKHFADALSRTLDLAAWDPRGSTSFANADQVARGVAIVLTLAYDWLHPRLDETQRHALLEVLETRLGDMYAQLIAGGEQIAVHPYDSHGNHTLTYFAALSTVLAGDVPAAADWLRDTLPLALNWTSPWGGEDGGFGNGTAYAQWITGDLLTAWNILRWTVDVDLAQKAWVRNYARFLAYFLPPGTPTGLFGDGAENRLDEQWARFGKAFTLFAPSPLGRWYASELEGEDIARLHLLLAPAVDLKPAPFPADAPNAAVFPSIGWAAMHSDLASPARTSVYFKSSAYGSFNHSHADQNSFVIHAGGQPLAIDSGYYDGYDTEHWRRWYKQTRAHNAITFDGGQGQAVFEESGLVGPGDITHFADAPAYATVSGDAALAYGGALERAQRSLVYLRPDLILVHDSLASTVPRRFEWNIHAVNAMQIASDGTIEIENGDASLCVAMLGGTEAAFTQVDDFTAAPAGSNMPAQWHGAFTATEPASSAEFVALLSVGCPDTDVAVARDAAGWQVEVAGHRVTFADGRALVTPL